MTRPAREENSMEVNRRNFLECMAWAGTGLVWTVSGGVLSSRTIAHAADAPPADFTFGQISDTHIGFKGQANADPVATMQESIGRLNGLTQAPPSSSTPVTSRTRRSPAPSTR